MDLIPSDNSNPKPYKHQLHVFEPPYPIKEKVYFCGKHFLTDPIIKLYPVDDNIYGLSIIHGENSYVYTFTNINYTLISKLETTLPNKHERGGQSQNRHQRNHDIMVRVYIDKVVDLIKGAYIDEHNVPIVNGIIIVGTGEKRFKIQERLPDVLKSLVYKNETIPSQNVTIESILQTFSKDVITDITTQQETGVWNEFLQFLNSNDSNRAIYGTKEVTHSLITGQLKQILIIQSKNNQTIKNHCSNVNCRIIEISNNSTVGNRLLHDFGGIVGITWF